MPAVERPLIYANLRKPGYTVDLDCYLRHGGYEALKFGKLLNNARLEVGLGETCGQFGRWPIGANRAGEVVGPRLKARNPFALCAELGVEGDVIERVRALVLRGIFMLRPHELRFFYQEGASFLYPDAWEAYLAPIPPAERDDLIAAYHRRLTSDDRAVRLEAARAWAIWEGATSRLIPDPATVASFGEDRTAEAFARIENHYFVNGGFLTHPEQLLDGVERIRRIPAVIVQGRYDVVCPMTTAWDLHRRWPEAEFHVVPDAGHAAKETGTLSRLVEATDRFRAAP